MSDLEQASRVLHRLATTPSPSLSPILAQLLPKVLILLGSASNQQVRAKLVEIVSHVVKRAKAEPVIRIPVQDILAVVLYDDGNHCVRPNLSAFTVNFSMVLLIAGIDGMVEDDVNKPPVLSALLTLLASTTPALSKPPDVLSSQVSHLVISRLLKLSERDRIGNVVDGEVMKAAQCVRCLKGDNKQIVELLLDILLYWPRMSAPPAQPLPSSPGSSPPPAEFPSSQPQLPTQLVPAGCSQFSLKRLLSPNSSFSKKKNFNSTIELARLKMAVIRLVSPSRGNIFGGGDRIKYVSDGGSHVEDSHVEGIANFVFLLVVASTDNNGAVADLASACLKNHLDSAHSKRLASANATGDNSGDERGVASDGAVVSGNRNYDRSFSLEVGDPLLVASKLYDLLLPAASPGEAKNYSRLSLFVDPSKASVVLQFLSKTVLSNHLKMFESDANNNNGEEVMSKILRVCNKGLYCEEITPSSSLSHQSQHLTPHQKCQINSMWLLNTATQILLKPPTTTTTTTTTTTAAAAASTATPTTTLTDHNAAMIRKILSLATIVLSRAINVDGCFPVDARDACYGIICSAARHSSDFFDLSSVADLLFNCAKVSESAPYLVCYFLSL